jgi:hypothetical protein
MEITAYLNAVFLSTPDAQPVLNDVACGLHSFTPMKMPLPVVRRGNGIAGCGTCDGFVLLASW